MKCQCLFYGKKKEKYCHKSSAETLKNDLLKIYLCCNFKDKKMAKYVASGETVHYGPSDPSGLNPYTIEHAHRFCLWHSRS